ncbi:MAG TPA: AgmX/PglI C-terminal domain-containing protein [Polyangium sp.]|nr:AgmX/PglI C-terminal domain-containing protein [Polyangium sp.]
MTPGGEVTATDAVGQDAQLDAAALQTTSAPALDIVVRWGDWVLGTHELAPPRPFFVGEQNVDVTLPREVLGARRLPVVLVRWDGKVHLVVPPNARIILGGQTKRMSAARLLARGFAQASTQIENAAEVPFIPGQTATLFFDQIAIDFAFTTAAPSVERKPLMEKRVIWAQTASFVLHALLVSLLFYAVGPADVDFTFGMTAEQLNEFQRRLWKLERNEARMRWELEGYEARSRPVNPKDIAAEHVFMDSWSSEANRWSDELTAEAQRAEIPVKSDSSLIGVLYDWPEPPPPPKKKLTIEEVMKGPGVVLPEERPGRLRFRGPQVRMGAVSVSGRLPPEVIQRIVRQNFGRFRLCYENGLRRNPNLIGRVGIRFTIGRDGAISNVRNGGSDLPDAGVVACVGRNFNNLEFPQPEAGIVTVVFPIFFAPASGD